MKAAIQLFKGKIQLNTYVFTNRQAEGSSVSRKQQKLENRIVENSKQEFTKIKVKLIQWTGKLKVNHLKTEPPTPNHV